MPKKAKGQIHQTAESSTGIQQLEALAGERDVELHVPTDPPSVIRLAAISLSGAGVPPNRTSLVVSSRRPTRSSAMTIRLGTIPCITSTRVNRLYEMSLENEDWKISKSSPGFSQRFRGKVRDSAMTGYRQRSSDGTNWERDFEMVFTKAP